jgi:hypothetical protein
MAKLTDSAVGPVPVFAHKVEIKKLTKSFGHEGPSYNCEVWIDGIRACHATEEGSGGGVMLHWVDKKLEKLVDDYAASLPRNDLYDPEERKDYEKQCHDYATWLAALTPEARAAYDACCDEFQSLDYLWRSRESTRDEGDACRERIDELKAQYPLGLEAPDPNYMYHTMHQDDVVDEWVNDWIEDEGMRKKCAKAICYHTKDQPKGQYWVMKLPFTEGNVAKILKKYPGAEIFNMKFGKPIPDAEAPAPPVEEQFMNTAQIAVANECLKEIREIHRASQKPTNPLLLKAWKQPSFEEQNAKEEAVWVKLKKLQAELGPGFRSGKLFHFPVADGRAHYMVLKIGKAMTELAWLPFGDAYKADAVEVVDKVSRGKRKIHHQCLTSVARRMVTAQDGIKAVFAKA